MKLELKQDLGLGRLTIAMAENCHGDSTPLIATLHFNRFHEKICADTAAVAGAVIASRWCGELLEFIGMRISPDFGDAIRVIVPDARFVQPIDGYRRNLCDGELNAVIAPASEAPCILAGAPRRNGVTRLVTWGGEFVSSHARSSAGYVAGEVSTNADILLANWEVSACLGLLVGGLALRTITVPAPASKERRNFERIAEALRIVGLRLCPADGAPQARQLAGNPALRGVTVERDAARSRRIRSSRRQTAPAL